MPRRIRSPRPRPLRRQVRRAVRAVRRRRAPEDARREILDAAEQLFAAHHPDALGLQPVARAAGVSHALITHYFGTYAGLVDAVLERRQAALRDLLVERLRRSGVTANADELFAALFESLADPVQVRLCLWSLATERPSSPDLFPLRNQGLRTVAAELAAAIGAARGVAAEALVPSIEIVLLTAVSAAFGYSLGKPQLVAALGRAPAPAIDAAVQATLREMVTEQIRRCADTVAAAAPPPRT